jgi:hypothetical protein
MGNEASGTPACEGEWPVKVTAGDLIAIIGAAGLRPAPGNPLAALLDRSTEQNRGKVEPTGLAPGLLNAVQTACNARQLLLIQVRQREGETRVLGFLNDGAAIVRFDAGQDGCLLDEPLTYDSFFESVGRIADIEDRATDESDVITLAQAALESILALRAEGLFEREGGRMPIARAEAILEETGAAGDGPHDRLEELRAAGLAIFESGEVLASAEWQSSYRFLCAPAPVTIEAAELGDLAAERLRRKRLAVLGDPAERILVAPTLANGPQREVLLSLPPATRESLRSGLEQLLAPPFCPPCTGVNESEVPLSSWLDATDGESSEAEWHLDALEDLVVPAFAESAAPAALLEPHAVIEITKSNRGGVNPERMFIALHKTDAAQWSIDGSLIRWRGLGVGEVSSAIQGLIVPKEPIPRGGEACDLLGSQLRALMAGSSAGEDLPAILLDLAADPRVTWCTIHVRYRRGAGGEVNRPLLLAYSETGGTWRFDPTGDVWLAYNTSPPDIDASITAALELSGA